MKKVLLVLTIFLSTLIHAQQEVSVDIGDALVMKTLEVSYERYLTGKNSIGVSALFNFNGDNADFSYNENTMITSFFRHYFMAHNKFNYFGEIFLGINSGERRDIKYRDGALGASVGAKYILNGGVVISGLVGIGRNMFNSASYEIVPRVGLNVGYRF